LKTHKAYSGTSNGIDIYCVKCDPDKEGNRIRLRNKETIRVNKDRAVDYYDCPMVVCGEKRAAAFENGTLIAVL
jgi:hypothetical protein